MKTPEKPRLYGSLLLERTLTEEGDREMALNHGGSSCNPRILKAGLGLMAVCLAAYIVGPPLYWHFMEGLAAVSRGSSPSSSSSSALNCPPCECDCSFQSLPSIPIGTISLLLLVGFL